VLWIRSREITCSSKVIKSVQSWHPKPTANKPPSSEGHRRVETKESLLKGKDRYSTLYLHVLKSSDQLLFYWKCVFLLLSKTCYLDKEVNCTEPSLSVRVPWSNIRYWNLASCRYSEMDQQVFGLSLIIDGATEKVI
jgi:hypothetical protein